MKENSFEICSKKSNLIAYVQGLNENKHKQSRLFPPRLISDHDLKRVEKNDSMEFLLLLKNVLPYMTSLTIEIEQK